MEWYQIALSILSGIATAIPLVVKLIQCVRETVKEKNWGSMVALVMNFMEQAESKFESGSDRKQWVLDMVEASAKTINYDVDIDKIGDLIDSLCNMSKKINT